MKVVTIGGGTGQYHTLRALMILRECEPLSITAIPTTMDSGGSSGVLRFDCQIVAPGDISQCILGLHPAPERADWLFGHRFNGGELKGHTVRNIIVAAALQQFGPTQHAIDAIRDSFELHGNITPITFSQSHLHAKLKDGTVLKSESEIYEANIVKRGGIERMWLEPIAFPNAAALRAIEQADVVIVCPGTLACSIIPNFLVESVVKALQRSSAQKVYIANLMNRRGHVSKKWTVLNHVEHLEEYLGEGFFNVVIANTQPLSPEQEQLYGNEKTVVPLLSDLHAAGRLLIACPLLMDVPQKAESSDSIAHLRASVRHHPARLARALEIALGLQRSEGRRRLFLDFDRTIFDTDQFHHVYASRIQSLARGEERLSNGELGQFVFSDVHPTLMEVRRLGVSPILLTNTGGNGPLQRIKMQGTGLESLFDEVLMVPKGVSKGRHLSTRFGKEVSGICVDDMLDVADSVSVHCPRIRFVHINRRSFSPAVQEREIQSLREILALCVV